MRHDLTDAVPAQGACALAMQPLAQSQVPVGGQHVVEGELQLVAGEASNHSAGRHPVAHSAVSLASVSNSGWLRWMSALCEARKSARKGEAVSIGTASRSLRVRVSL